MSNKAENNFLIAVEAAAVLRMSKRTLDTHRCKGTGPKFRRHGGRIVYRLGDILEWSEHRAARNSPQRPDRDSCIGRRRTTGIEENRLSSGPVECEP